MADGPEVVFNSKKVRKFLAKIEKNSKGITDKNKKYVDLLSAIVFSDVIKHFEEERAPQGKWKKWSDVYTDHMRKIGKGGNRILQDSGSLRQAFKPTDVRLTSQGLLWFNNAKTRRGFPYAAAHNIGGGKLPKRQFMWISKAALGNIEDQTLKFILSGG